MSSSIGSDSEATSSPENSSRSSGSTGTGSGSTGGTSRSGSGSSTDSAKKRKARLPYSDELFCREAVSVPFSTSFCSRCSLSDSRPSRRSPLLSPSPLPFLPTASLLVVRQDPPRHHPQPRSYPDLRPSTLRKRSNDRGRVQSGREPVQGEEHHVQGGTQQRKGFRKSAFFFN